MSCRQARLGHHGRVAEERLGGGRGTAGVVRIGDTVHRPTGPWTPTIHAYLRHLREAGFTAAPEVLGFDEKNREVLTYIHGQTWGDAISPDEPKTDLVTIRAWPDSTRSDRSLAEVGRLYAALHRAARGFRPERPIWREYELPFRPDEIVTHGDAGPWNVVYDGWQPVGLIDWDSAQPRRPIDDLAAIAWHFVPLGPDTFLSAFGFQPPFSTARRLRVLCDAYGLVDRSMLLPVLSTVRQLGVEKLRYWQPLRPGIGAQHLRAAADDLSWLEDATAELRSALG